MGEASSRINARDIICWCAIIALACILSYVTWHASVSPQADGCQYITGGLSLLAGQGYLDTSGDPQTIFPPGYPLMIGFAAKLVPDPVLAARLVSASASILTIIPLMLLASRLFGARTGLALGFIYAVLPERLRVADRIYTEPLYILLLVTAAWLWLRESKEFRWWRSAALGAVLAGAYLVRPEGIVCAGVLLILSLPLHRWWPTLAGRSLIICAAVLALGMAPYMLYLHSCTGQWSVSPKTSINWAAGSHFSKGAVWEQTIRLNDAATELDYSVQETRSEALKRFLGSLRKEMSILAGLLGPFLAVCLVLGLGMVIPCGSEELKRGLPVLVALSVPLLFLPAFFIQSRFVYSASIPALAVACWMLMTRFYVDRGKLPGRLRGRIVGLLPLIIVAAALAKADVDVVQDQSVRGTPPALSAWVAANVPPDASLMDFSPERAYYARRKWCLLPHDTLKRTLHYARFHHVQYLLLAKDVTLSPDLAKAAAGKPAPGLEPIGQWRDRIGWWAKIYRIH